MAAPETMANLSPVPALAPERPVVWPQRTVRTLANGLQVVLAELHTIPKFDAQLIFRSGNAAASAQPGIAELTSSVVRTGTARRSQRQIDEDLRRMGADLGCGAGTDSSAISFDGLSEFSAELLQLAAELAQEASFPAAEFERERRQKMEELKIERATPGFLAGERMRKALFGGHPYASVAPTIAEVESYSREHLETFYRTHYSPANAVLVVVGDFSAAHMLEQVERAFGSWKGAVPPATEFSPAPEHKGRHVHLVHLPGAVQTQVLTGNRAITRKHPDWFALSLANAIFGGAFHSRLVMNIREQKGYTYSPRSSVTPLRHDGFFTVHAAVRNEVVAATLTEIFYEMDRMRALPVGSEELDDTRNYLSGVFSLGLATLDGLGGQLATVYLNDLPEDYLESYRQRIRALSAEDALRAARRYFDSANAQIVVLGERREIEPQAALFGEVSVVDAAENGVA
jgi:predicted Zn-dependent peptidase